jgi:cobalt-zinc-cadmium efflux system outer membrane protein
MVLAWTAALAGGSTSAASVNQAEVSEIMPVETAVSLAVVNNPGLDDLRRRAEAAAAVPSQVSSLPDPRISIGAGNVPVDTFSLDQEAMTQLQLGVTQVFPYPGKLALRREWAESEAAAATESAEEGRLRLVRDVRSNWWELFYLDRAAETIAHNIDLLRQLVEIARAKYEVGRGLQQDVLLAQVELSRLQDMAIQIRGMRAATCARMNALLDRPAESRIALPRTVDAPLPRLPPQDSLEADAEQSRASIAQAQHEVDAAQSAQALAHKEYLPEFGVSVVYGWRQGNNTDGSPRSDMASAMLNFSVPLFASSKQDQLVAQRRAESAARERALAETRNRVQAEIATAVAGYVQARDEYSLLETGILPQTRQAVESMLAGYQVSKVDFLTLIRTQVTLYDYELQRWRAQSKAQQALAMLSAAVGRETF